MKLVTAIIQPYKLDAVRGALQKVGCMGLTVSDVQGYGRQKGHSEVYRGHEYTVSFVRKVKLEIAVEDSKVDAVLVAIGESAKNAGGKIGDGKIFVVNLEEAMRIRTGERGESAL